MNLYLLKSHKQPDYDQYRSCVVSAESEEDAREIHPHDSNDEFDYDSWRRGNYSWFVREETWVLYSERSELIVTMLGESCVPRGVICADFKAG